MLNAEGILHKDYKSLPSIETSTLSNGDLYTSLSDGTNFYQISATVSNKYIIILSNIAESRSNPFRCIDFYSIDTGKYLGSFSVKERLDERPIELFSVNNQLVISYEESQLAFFEIYQ